MQLFLLAGPIYFSVYDGWPKFTARSLFKGTITFLSLFIKMKTFFGGVQFLEGDYFAYFVLKLLVLHFCNVKTFFLETKFSTAIVLPIFG